MGGYDTPVILSRTQRVSGIPEKHRTIAVLEIQNVRCPIILLFVRLISTLALAHLALSSSNK